MDINFSLNSGIEFSEDEDQVTKRKNAAMKQVFQIPSIFEQIIQEAKNLSDLKQCRLVSSNWKETTTKMMLKRNSAYVGLNLDSRSSKYKKFIHWDNPHFLPSYFLKDVEDTDDLTTLTAIVDKSTQFPCSTFVICKGDLSYPMIGAFFDVVGKFIKNLKLVDICEKSVKFGELLGLNCPNLESLYMDECEIDFIPDDISFELPKLKMLKVNVVCLCLHEEEQEEQSLFKMLGTLIAPNLQVIRGFYLYRDWEAVANAGKIHCVKELNFFILLTPDHLTKLEMFVQVGPQLETLKLDLCGSFDILDSGEKSKWMRLIQKLLDLSKTTLKSFSFTGIEDVFGNLTFPQFPQLREIEINSWRAVEGGVRYPYGILSDDISPNLQVIKGIVLSRDTDGVVRAGRIHCVNELDLDLGEVDLDLGELILEDLRLFLSFSPQLESLIFNVELNDMDRTIKLTGLLQQLLVLSKGTLKSFNCDGVGDLFEDMQFPKFSILKKLGIVAGPIRIFPRGINLTESFPMLEIFCLRKCIELRNDENWVRNFPPPDAFTGSLASVKTLIVSKQFTDAANRKVKILCPNAKLVYFD